MFTGGYIPHFPSPGRILPGIPRRPVGRRHAQPRSQRLAGRVPRGRRGLSSPADLGIAALWQTRAAALGRGQTAAGILCQEDDLGRIVLRESGSGYILMYIHIIYIYILGFDMFSYILMYPDTGILICATGKI
jgi:hypothetical protein